MAPVETLNVAVRPEHKHQISEPAAR